LHDRRVDLPFCSVAAAVRGLANISQIRRQFP
jgi:hypothetical protein